MRATGEPSTTPCWAGGDSVVPDGTRFVARLDNALSTTNAREGDRWTMTAQSPSQYQGAVIEGFVSSVNASGRPAGSSDMTLNLQSIRLRNGGTYQFDGVIDSIRTPDGETISVDREGTVDNRDGRDDGRTEDTLERGAIGAALGALIGAVAGGGKGRGHWRGDRRGRGGWQRHCRRARPARSAARHGGGDHLRQPVESARDPNRAALTPDFVRRLLMWNKDERDGKIDQAKGRVKQAVGDLTKDKDLKAEGRVDEAKGQVQEAVGEIRRKAGEAIKKVGDTVKR